jgi:hypothetical protein
MWGEMYGLVRTQALYVAASLGIADLLAEGPQDAVALATATSSHAPSLSRVLRFLAACGLLSKDEDGRYSLTAFGDMLRSDSPLPTRAGAIFYGSPFLWAAWGNLLETVRTGTPGFEIAHGSPLFDYLGSHPEDLRVFTEFMTSMARPRFAGAAAGYQFPDPGLVVDVGGGEGAMMIAILEAHPGLRGILFDLPEVAAKASDSISRAGLAERCIVQSGDFFEQVPDGGDPCILSNILHDWDDEHCRQILTNCHRSMRTGARLLIIDTIMPERDPPFGLAALDLQMMVALGGKQRTESEVRLLLDETGFRLLQSQSQGTLEAEAV